MNIEGAERLALPGMKGIVEETEIACVSCHDFKYARTRNEFFRTKAIVEEFLKNHGFVLVPHQSSESALADQVNAYNPKFFDGRSLEHLPRMRKRSCMAP